MSKKIIIGINNYYNYTTGCGASPGSGSSETCNAYNTSTGMLASTTGNIYGNSYDDQTACNRARLGDATGEVMLTANYNGVWYNDTANFVYSYDLWFLRGSDYTLDSVAGVFSFVRNEGLADVINSARAALLAL